MKGWKAELTLLVDFIVTEIVYCPQTVAYLDPKSNVVRPNRYASTSVGFQIIFL